MASEGLRERALPAPALDEPELALPVPHVPKLALSGRVLARLLSISFALALFVLSLQLMKRGAAG
ncbi:MAG: hypothetical protein M0015_06995, partial [Betaproteobacteria bacterium]|nr:hypothetical protein [Betaproteobacteria bacterium]